MAAKHVQVSPGLREVARHPAERDSFRVLLGEVVTLRIALFTLALLIVGLFLVIRFHGKSDQDVIGYIGLEVGKMVLLSVPVTGLIKWLLTRQSKSIQDFEKSVVESTFFDKVSELGGQLNASTSKIESAASTSIEQSKMALENVTSYVGACVSSLAAMQLSGVRQVYPNRSAAAQDIYDAICSEDATDVRIIGISLNDFTRGIDQTLHQAWTVLKNRIEKGLGDERMELRVRILLIDPDCAGADYRSRAECADEEGLADRLMNDVRISLATFHNVKSAPNVTFAVKLYRTAPIAHLIWTPSVAFVEQYYFRPRHGGALHIPMLRLQPLASTCVQRELGHHFDWLWNEASISDLSYMTLFERGADRAIRQANISNIYYDHEVSRRRMVHTMVESKERIWMQGVSLKSFFEPDSDLLEALSKACHRGVKVRALFLDPECEQAKMRSRREYLLGKRNEHFTEATHLKSPLYQDTCRSLQCAEQMRSTFPDHFSFSTYETAPVAFMLLTDDALFVEQYHYGKEPNPKAGFPMLGKDVPVVEYGRKGKSPRGDVKDPYEIFADHLDFVFDEATCQRPSMICPTKGDIDSRHLSIAGREEVS